jgi:hypothetical protein
MLSVKEGGLAVADEQASTGIRKYNISQKLQQFLDGKMVYGGSGPSDIIREIYEMSKGQIERVAKERGVLSVRNIFEIVNSFTIQYKNQLKNNVLNASLGIGLDDLLTGTLLRVGKPLDDGAKNYGGSILQKFDQETQTEILLGGIEDNKFDIYRVNTQGVSIKSARPNESIGSGADESEKVLSNYVARLKRNQKDEINLMEGLTKIIEATNASARLNIGVGGTISIAYISGNGIKMPTEDRCRLASEIVEGLTFNLIAPDVSYDLLQRVIFKDEKDETIEAIDEEMKTKTKDWKKLDRLLRGYKE